MRIFSAIPVFSVTTHPLYTMHKVYHLALEISHYFSVKDVHILWYLRELILGPCPFVLLFIYLLFI
jgi:hypothetical protein